MRLLLYLIIACIFLQTCHSANDGNDSDGDASRKILGSSVVTSVSVVMDTGNKKTTIFTDAVGKPQSKPTNPSELASPIDLLNPDRYEFYTFDDNGDLVKRLMSLEEIKSIIARGDSDALDLDSFTAQGFLPERRVSDVVSNVQNVLKEEMEILKDPVTKPIFDTPDVSDSWSMILPAVFGNSGEDIKPEKPAGYVTPDTIMVEPNSHTSVLNSVIATTNKIPLSSTSSVISTTPIKFSKPVYYSSTPLPIITKTPQSSTTTPTLNVEIISNGVSSATTANEPPKYANASSNPKEEVERIPTRVPILQSPSPPLVRNVTKTPPQTTSTTTTQKITSTEASTQSTASTSTTVVPNIFGLPSFVDVANFKVATSTLKPTRSPPQNHIFGFPFPVPVEQKNNPTTSLLTTAVGQSSTSTSPKPIIIKGSSAVTSTSTSQISVKPSQLSTTSTIANQYSTSSSLASKTDGTTNTEDNYTTTWAPNPEDTQLFNIFKEVLSQSAARPEIISKNATFSSSSPSSVEFLITADSTSSISDVLSFESNKIPSTTNPNNVEDLSTTSSEEGTPTTTDIDPDDNAVAGTTTAKLPSILNALNDKQKVSASELLDQLLLTTNIYEINTELASSAKLNASADFDERFDGTSTTTDKTIITDSEQQITTTTDQHNTISYPPTTTTATDATLIQSIEQLLSQAVGDVQTVLSLTTTESAHQQHKADGGKTDITTSNTEPQSSIISTTDAIVTTPSNSANNLNSSVEALLSQVNDQAVDLNKILFTENPNVEVTSYRRVDEDTTYSPSTLMNKLDTTVTEQELEPSTTTIYYIVKKTTPPTTEDTIRPQQLINITVFSYEPLKNRTKPAKADLSLEQELIKEELKNMTLLQTNTSLDSPPLNESSTTTTITQAASNIDTTTIVAAAATNAEETSITTDAADTTTNDVRFAEQEEDVTTTEFAAAATTTTDVKSDEVPIIIQSSTVQYSAVSTVPKPSIVITVNPNSTIVTESGKIVANKTIITTTSPLPLALTKPPKNSSQDQQHHQTWTLVSTLAPQHAAAASQNKLPSPPTNAAYPEAIDPPAPVDLVPKPMQGFGLEESTANLEVDVHQFAQLCNELAFGFWKTVTTGLSSARSLFVSPFAATSMLAMVFLGAKGATSEEMNEILKLDDMVTFNPHLTFKSVSESVVSDPNSGIATAAIVRELFSDRSKGKLLDFYKNRVRAFYDGFAEEVSYREIGDVIRRRSNLLVKKYTNGKYVQFLNDASITARSPLSGVSINIFETDCSQTSSEGRDGELHFIVFPSMKQRRLVPVPAVVYKSGFLAGYEPSLDATAVALGGKDQIVSTILVIPGQQGIAAPGDGLARLEKRLVESSLKKGAWSRLLRSLIPRHGLEVQIPRFSHRSVINATNTLQRMGLHELFNPESADLRGLNGVPNELHLSDVLQINKFATCGEKRADDSHHSEVYPATTMRARAARRLHRITTTALFDQEEPRDYQRAFPDPLHDPTLLELPLPLRPRQARVPDVPRLRFDRPFLYFVRHNPTGLILHMGRFNPRLLP